jgi:1-deoxy-D-xylulose-5-phosphate synthase
VLDRAGITGADGPSHNGMWDLSILGVVPGMRIAAPRDEPTLREELREAVEWTAGPTVLRFPKTPIDAEVPAVGQVGTLDLLRAPAGAEVLIVSVGAMATTALDVADRIAAEGVAATVVDPRWVSPVDRELVALAARHRLVVTIEDGGRAGGVGSRVSQALRDAGVDVPARDVGIPQRFLGHGAVAQVKADIGLTAQDVARRVLEWVSGLDATPDQGMEPEHGGLEPDQGVEPAVAAEPARSAEPAESAEP